jgi:hypothetical protein
MDSRSVPDEARQIASAAKISRAMNSLRYGVRPFRYGTAARITSITVTMAMTLKNKA